jgi:hypothetical protein
VVNAQARLNAALRALANNVGSNLTGITAAQVGALAPNGDGSALTGITADQVGALASNGDGSALTGITATQVGALEPTGDGSALTGITAAQVGAIAETDTLTQFLNFPNAGIRILDATGDHVLQLGFVEELTASRALFIAVNDANRTINLSGNLTVSAAATISGTNTGDVTLTGTPDYITISGQTITRNAIDLATDVTGTLPIANGGTGQTSQTAAFDALAPTTTKGDLIVHNGTDNVRVPVGGTNGHVLTVDSAEATGVKWAAGGGGGSGTKTIAVFTPRDNQPPSSGFATLDTRNSIAILDFDDASTEGSIYVGVIPEAAVLTSGIIVSLRWMATTATSGNVRWSVSFERCNTDLDTDSFDTATAATATTNGTSGIVTVTDITCTSIDSLAALDLYRVRVQRLGGDGADTMTGDAELVAVELRTAN